MTDQYRYKLEVTICYPARSARLAHVVSTEYTTGDRPLTRGEIQDAISARYPDADCVHVHTINPIDPTRDGRQVDMFAPQQLTL